MLKHLYTSLRDSAEERQDATLLKDEKHLPLYLETDRFTLWIRRVSYAACAALFTTCAAILIVWSLTATQGDATWTSCGRSPEVARMNGCNYHPMLSAWIPPECSTLELMEGYDPYAEGEWYLDDNSTQPADRDKLRAGEVRFVYTANAFHVQHCTYAWKVLSWAVENRRSLINSKSGSSNHTNHCAEVISTALVNNNSVGVPLLYLTCVPLY
jgi:hypothetical protein